jgi:hypothetical protein
VETSDEEATEMSREPTNSSLKTLGIVIASLGGVSLAAGIVTGSLALSKNKVLADRCPDKDQNCPGNNENLANSAMSLGMVANVFLPIGAAAVTTGAILAVVGHRKKSKQRESMTARFWRIAPYGTQSEAGLFIEGRF